MIKDIRFRIKQKKEKLDEFRPLSQQLVKNLEEWYRVELTYTSNAIEGNTLTRSQTAIVIEKGITVEGKSIIEHQEAINHAKAIEFIIKLAKRTSQEITQENILDIHKIILSKIDESQAGRYRNMPVRIAGSRAVMPNPLKIQTLMDEFENWMRSAKSGQLEIAADAHLKLVTIHPFADGNGRTARLLMNLILIRGGYPPAIIRKEDRRRYIESIEKAQLGYGTDSYFEIVFAAIERSLDIYLETVGNKDRKAVRNKERLFKIGELSKETGETVHTLRFWTREGLLGVADYTAGGYQLYDFSMIEIVRKIRKLQKDKRLTIEEIKAYLN